MLRALFRGSIAQRATWILVVASFGGCVLSTETTFYDAHDLRGADSQGNAEGGLGDADAARDDVANLDATDVVSEDSGVVAADVPDADVQTADVLRTDVPIGPDAVADACVPTPEICNNIDDDCNGMIDDGLAPMTATCGVGACVRTSACVAGAPVCTPGAPGVETCNTIDDDCDGAIDNVVVSCGIGACRRVAFGCSGSVPAACVPGGPVPEACNGADDDCDGTVDDNIPVPPCGLGTCMVRPAAACLRGVPLACTPTAPTPEVCFDGLDNDCDGVVDDGCACARYVAGGGSGSGLTTASPMGSIQAAIDSLTLAASVGTVCVAANVNAGICAQATFAETVNMAEGISVLGGFTPVSFTRTDPACVTVISPVASTGVFFGHNITNATVLDGFTITNLFNAGATVVSTAAVTIQAGGTLTNNVIIGGTGTTSIGVNFTPAPGGTGSALVAGNTIRGGSSSGTRVITNSFGIRVSNLTPVLIANPVIEGGSTSSTASTSIGLDLLGAGGTLVADNGRIAGGGAIVSTGLHVTGNPTGLLITRNSIQGGASAVTSRGIHLESCSNSSPIVIRTNTRILGGNGSASTGIDVVGCTTTIDTNTAIIGRNVGTNGDAAGVHCAGAQTNCAVRSNARVIGFDAPASGGTIGRGVWIEAGANALVQGNLSINACVVAGATCHGVHIDVAGVVSVDANRIDANAGSGFSNGLITRQTNSLVTNNLVLLDNGNGLAMDNRPLMGRPTEAIFHSNTVIAQPLVSAARATNLIVIDNEPAGTLPNGVIRNNLVACLGAAVASRVAVRETGVFADPRIIENNELFGCGTLYFDADTARALTLISQVNAQPDLPIDRNNVSMAPGFVAAADYHLIATSPLINLGVPSGAPASDFDGDPRPIRGAWDIGFDEVAP